MPQEQVKSLSFEQIFAPFQEVAERQKETERMMQEQANEWRK
jgi:hypothetical protein